MPTSTFSGQPAAASRSLREAMRQHPLFFFFLMAYAFSWIMVIPFILEEWGYLPKVFSYTFILVPFAGPFLAAFIMTQLTEGTEGPKTHEEA